MDTTLKALIIDDEEGARKLLKELLDETHYFNDLRFAHSSSSANAELRKFDPDMIFLDIKMPDKDGFDFLKELSHRNGRPGVVFVTAYEQYALKAIKYQAFDYLLKPVNRKDLRQCVQKYLAAGKDMVANAQMVKQQITPERMIRVKVNTRTGTLFVNPLNILYCKADGNYTIIHTGERELLCSMNIGRLKDILPDHSFIRIGRSLILNLEHITHLDRRQSNVTLTHQGKSVTVKIPRIHLKEMEMI